MHYAELIVGVVLLVAAIGVFAPMKRYYANYSSIVRNDEILVVIWLLAVIFSITMILYSVA